MLDKPSKEPKFPDLSQIGLAFAQAITYINYQPSPDLDENARQWLIEAGTEIMEQLKTSLNYLQENKDDRIKLPAWALDPEKEMDLFSLEVPYTLTAYKGQFETCLVNLLEACGFDVTPMCGVLCSKIWVKIRFREAGLRRPTEAHKPGELCSDMVFMKEFYDTMSELRITQ
ncbi:uncharacterized protein H6S33_004009 [Morchella sextelata]|uniref:uncharacterized protein n=1 Tax=Morchella sextelata TaxID=1174677 RepID=UPI001D036193|nr:uncharacterized protein H6S33_004009 [Morchella sextelata]KAH0606348.1 hypothetical protein H6S33_004009 [Morchella sextelata]